MTSGGVDSLPHHCISPLPQHLAEAILIDVCVVRTGFDHLSHVPLISLLVLLIGRAYQRVRKTKMNLLTPALNQLLKLPATMAVFLMGALMLLTLAYLV